MTNNVTRSITLDNGACLFWFQSNTRYNDNLWETRYFNIDEIIQNQIDKVFYPSKYIVLPKAVHSDSIETELNLFVSIVA